MYCTTSLSNLFFVFLFILVPSVSAQDTIYWSEQRPLSWRDFQGTPDMSKIESAQTTSGVALELEYSENLESGIWEYTYKVNSYFLPALSWYKPNDINYYLLEHEQTHFAISELFARKLNKELSKLTPDETIGEVAENIYNRMKKEHVALQHKYDEESKHSLNIDRELQWQKMIKDSLAKYNDWK